MMGVGLATAVLIDATIVRAVLLPATMKLLGNRNWYLPSWLDWLPHVAAEQTGGTIPASMLIASSQPPQAATRPIMPARPSARLSDPTRAPELHDHRNHAEPPSLTPPELTGLLTAAAGQTGTEARPEPKRHPPVTPNAASRRVGRSIGMIVAGSALTLIALGALAGGAYGLWLHTTHRSDGYVMTSTERFATGSYALATRTLRVSSDLPGFLYGRDWLGNVRLRGKSANPNRPLFIGIARKEDVDRYLAGVAHSDVVDVNANLFGSTRQPTYRAQPGGNPPTPPDRARFWVAHAAGRGDQALSWRVQQGRWSVVVMRPDGSRGVSAELAAGATLPALPWASVGLAVVGLLILAGAVALIHATARALPAS
jgi:hypothetical protein